MAEQMDQSTEYAGFIVDARGRRVTQLDPVLMHVTHRRGDMSAEVLRRVANEVGIGLHRGTRLAFWSAMICLLSVPIALTICIVRYHAGTIDAGRFVRNLVPYVAVITTTSCSWISLRAARHQKIGRAMLAHRRCPHCGYDLRGLPADSTDAATTCPECGCAWKLSDADRTEKDHRHDTGETGST